MRAAHGGYKGIVNLLLTAKSPASTRVTNKVSFVYIVIQLRNFILFIKESRYRLIHI